MDRPRAPGWEPQDRRRLRRWPLHGGARQQGAPDRPHERHHHDGRGHRDGRVLRRRRAGEAGQAQRAAAPGARLARQHLRRGHLEPRRTPGRRGDGRHPDGGRHGWCRGAARRQRAGHLAACSTTRVGSRSRAPRSCTSPTATTTGCGWSTSSPGPSSRVAGTSAGYAGNGGPAGSARLRQPRGLAVTPQGDLLVAESGNSVLRKVAASRLRQAGDESGPEPLR